MDVGLQWLELIATASLIAVLVCATILDVTTHRIPNALLLPALIIALIVAAMTTGATGLLLSIAGFLVGMAVLLPLYALGAMGAGDVKLLGVAGAFLAPYGALVAGVATLILGGVYGILWVIWRASRPGSRDIKIDLWFPWLATILPRFASWLSNLANSQDSSGQLTNADEKRLNNKFAYAPAIASGCLFAMWQLGSFTHLIMSN